MVGELPVINLSEAKFECTYGRGCAGLCCQNGRPGVYPEEVERLILSDQVLVAEVLRAANSPFFGGLSMVHTVRTAIVRLGLKQVAQLALMASHRSTYEAKDPILRNMIRVLWGHASATALAANWLVRRLGVSPRALCASSRGARAGNAGRNRRARPLV